MSFTKNDNQLNLAVTASLTTGNKTTALGSPEWLAWLRVELARAWEDGGRGRLLDCRITKTIKRPYSEVRFLEVSTPAGTSQVVAKSTVPDPMNRPFWERQVQATVEYEILAHAHQQFEPVPGISVPQPICVVPELDTFVMEFVAGTELSQGHAALRYFSSRHATQLLSADYARLGRWLNKFQQVTKPTEGDASHLDGIRERISLRLDKINEQQDKRVPHDFVSQVEKRLESLLAEAACHAIPIAGRHGDFGPWNVFVNDRQNAQHTTSRPTSPQRSPERELIVMDFMGYAREPRPLDAINVLHFLDKEGAGLVSSRALSRVVQRQFLRGLNWQLVCSQPLLELCELHARVYSVWGALSATPDRWHHKLQENKFLRRCIAWLQQPSMPGVWQLLQRAAG